MKKRLMKLCGCLAAPVIAWVIMEILCQTIAGTHVIGRMADVKTYIRTLLMVCCTAWALNCNITSGRIDFSLGAVMVTAPILGGNLALRFGLGGFWLLVISIGIALVMGAVVGIVYVITGINPLMLSLGMALLYEAMGYQLSGHSGLQLSNTSQVLQITETRFLVLTFVVVLLVTLFVIEKTSFGFHYRALQRGQGVAVSAGVNEKRNAVLCYMIAGGLVAITGVVKAGYQGAIDPALGLSSVTGIFDYMLAVFVGGFIGRFCNGTLGIFFASMMMAFLNVGMSTMGVSQTKQSIVIAVLLLAYLIFEYNQDFFVFARARKARKALALAERQKG